MDRPHRYDAFLSYRHQEPDSTFVRDLLARLENASYTVAIDERDFAPNLPFLQEMERCIRESRFTLAVVSPRYLDSGNCEEEAVICKVLDMGERKRRLLPLGIEKVETPVWMYNITGIDFTAKDPLLDPYEKLERTLGIPLRLSDSERFQIHPRVGEVFAGREKELDEIAARLLWGGRPITICALQGMPGVGKSYLADRFYHLHTFHFPGGYQRLVLDPAGPSPTAASLLAELADRLKIQPDFVIVRGRLLQPHTLLHIENVDSESLAQAAAGLLAKLQRCPILVTGRLRGLGASAGWGRVEVRPLSEDEAYDQLLQELGSQIWEEEDAYRRLVRELGFLSLAIHLAAGHLREGRTVDVFLERLRATGLTLEPEDEADPMLANRERAILANTFKLSLDLLRKQLAGREMDADRLIAGFHALAQTPASGFGASLGTAIADLSASEFEQLVFDALRLSLLERVPLAERPDRAWRLHTLTSQLLRHLHGEEEGRRAFGRITEWFVSRFSQLPSGQEEEMGRRWREVQAETEALTAWLTRVRLEDQRTMRFAAGTVPGILQSPTGLDEALRGPQDVFEKVGGLRERALTLGKIAEILQARGQLDEALRIRQEEQIPIYEEIGDLRERAVAFGRIADILQARGHLDEALRIRREEQLPVFERIGDIHSRVATLDQIAGILQARGQLDEALRIRKEEQLPALEKIGDIHERALALGKIVEILQARGQLDEALSIAQVDEVPVHEKIGDIPSRAVALGQIVDILQARGQLDEALSIGQVDEVSVHDIDDLRSRAVTIGQVADIFKARGQLDEALRIRQDRQLLLYEKIGDVESLLVARVNLALIYLERNEKDDLDTATELLGRSLAAAERLRVPEADEIREILQRIGEPGNQA